MPLAGEKVPLTGVPGVSGSRLREVEQAEGVGPGVRPRRGDRQRVGAGRQGQRRAAGNGRQPSEAVKARLLTGVPMGPESDQRRLALLVRESK